MALSWFAWNGTDSRAMGMWLVSSPSVVWPEERVEHITIPGRSGDLTDLQGPDVYNSYIQTVNAWVVDSYRARDVKRWLRGSGTVTFSGEPEVMQLARVIGAVTLNKHSRNLDIWTGEVQFYCQPFKMRLRDVTTTVAPSGTVYNAGDVTERPIFTLTATSATVVISAGGNTLTLSGMNGETVQIDSEAMMVWTSDLQTDMTGHTSGDWPVLAVGSNTVTGSGWTSASILRKERFF